MTVLKILILKKISKILLTSFTNQFNQKGFRFAVTMKDTLTDSSNNLSRPQIIRLTSGSFVGLFLHGLIIAAPGAFLPQWQAEFGSSLRLGVYYNLFLIGSLIGLRLASTQKQRHPLFAFSFLAIGLALALAAVMGNFSGILVAAAILSLGDGILNLQCNSLVGELHPQRSIVMLNWANATFGLGSLITPLLGTFLPWRLTLIVVAILALLSVTLVWDAPTIKNFSPQRERMPWQLASPFLLIILVYTGLESSLGTWNGNYLFSLGWDETVNGILLSLYWGCLTLGRITLASWVARRPTRKLKILLFASLAILGLTLIPPLALIFPLAAFCYGPLFGTIFALLQLRCGHVALAYLFYAAYIGKTLIPAIFSLIENPNFLPTGFIFLALLLYLISSWLAASNLTFRKN